MAAVSFAVSVTLYSDGKMGGKRKTTLPVKNLRDAFALRDSIVKAGEDREAQVCAHVQTRMHSFLIPIEDIDQITDRMMEIVDEYNQHRRPKIVG